MKKLKSISTQRTLIAIILCFTFLLGYIPPVYAAETANSTVGQTYYGFKLLDEKNVKEIKSTVKIFEHIKSGAKLVYLDNTDENKVFSINFYTPPTDDTGVNHIIEHSVLDGSKKYQVKSPFEQMAKQSLRTYLNASTYNDRTCFPVASENDKDLKNLMSVYLDAVFYPNFLKNPEIFKQEGWRYEIDSNGKLNYNGVVYNEMKARYSSPESILNYNISKSLYPDTLYNWNAGGNPDVMPQLTYEKFVDVYKKNYHPSNSYIYLYGNLNIMDYLKFINDEYLSKFDKVIINSNIPMQKPFDERQNVVSEYSVSNEADTKNNTYISLNYVLDSVADEDNYWAMRILNDLLMNVNDAPLKKAINNASICQSSSGSMDSKLQPTYSINIKNSNEASKSKFETVVTETLEKLAKDGFTQKSIDEALLAYRTSDEKDASTSTGIDLNQTVVRGWLYAKDPLKYLEATSSIDYLKKSSNSKFFQELIQKNLLNNKHTSLVVLKPKAGMEKDNIENTEKKLSDYKASLSDNQLADLIKQADDFKKWQNTPDSQEVVDSLPSLSLSDIDTKAEVLPLEEKDINGVKVLIHKMDAKSSYVNMYFDSSVVPQDKLPYLSLLCYLLGKMDTDKYTVADMKNTAKADNSSVNYTPIAASKYKDNKVFYPKLSMNSRITPDKMSEVLGLINEINTKSKLDNKSKIKSNLKSIKNSLQSSMNDNGLNIATGRLQSYFSPIAAYSDQVKGFSYYQFVCDLYNNFDNNGDAVVKNLKDTYDMVFNKNDLIVSFTGNEKDYQVFEQNLDTLLTGLGNSKFEKNNYAFTLLPKNEGIMTSSKVQYTAKGANLENLGYQFNANMFVMQSILSKEYLYKNVRVKGGAYGTGLSVSNTGNVLFYSLRDPNLKETLKVFEGAPNYLKNLKISETDMKNYIIGTMASIDAPRTLSSKGSTSDINYIIGRTQADIQKERDQILSAKKEDMLKYADMLDAIVNENNFCVYGSETLINKNKGIFTNTLNVSDISNNK